MLKTVTFMPLFDRHVLLHNTSSKYRFIVKFKEAILIMKTPLGCWMLFLAVICGIQQLSWCGVIIAHQRDLIWAEDKSTEVSNIEKRDDQYAKSNITVENNGTFPQNKTLSANDSLATSNETRAFEKPILDLFVNKTDGLNLNTTNIDEKVIETSQEESERQTRSNGFKKPCRSQLLSYNPITFTSHEFDKEYNPPPVIQQPSSYTKPNPTGNYKPSHGQEGKDKRYPVFPKIQAQHNQNQNKNPGPSKGPSHLLCKGGYSYSDKEGVCVFTNPRAKVLKSTSYPVSSQYPGAVKQLSAARDLVRPQLKEFGLQHGSYPVYKNEKRVEYRDKPAEHNGGVEHVQLPNEKYLPSGPTQGYLPKPQYPLTVAVNKPYSKPQTLGYQAKNDRGVLQYSQVGSLSQLKPKPYLPNEPREYRGNSYVKLTAKNDEDKLYASKPVYKQPGEKHETPTYEKPSYSNQQETQHGEDRIPRPLVGHATEDKYSSEEENSPSSYLAGYGKDDSNSSEDSYGGKSPSEKECLPIKQYLAEKESTYKSEQGSDDSSEYESNSPSSYSKEMSYNTSYSGRKSSSTSLGHRKKSTKKSCNKPETSLYTNPYVSLYKSKDSSKYSRKKPKYSSGESKYPSNYEMTYEDDSYVSCKKPKALNEIVLPGGGFILEGEYVLQRKSGKEANEDYEKQRHCPNYPRIIDRITIGKGGYIHKGRYTLDKEDRNDYHEESAYKTERTKKEVGKETDEDEYVEISIPFQIEADDDDDDGVHISTPREIDDEMFDDEELEDKTVQKRQLPSRRLPTIIVPVDLNLVDPLLRGVGKITKDVNKIKLKIKQKEIQNQVNRAIKNLKHMNQDHKEKMDRLKSDLKKKLEPSSAQKTPLINRDTGNNVKTLSTTFNFNSPAFSGPLGSPILRQLRSSKPSLSDNLLPKSLLPGRFSESDEVSDPIFVRRQSVQPRAYEDEEDTSPYTRNRLAKSSRSRSQYNEDSDEEPSRLSLFDPAPVQMKRYRSRPPATCPLESHRQRSQPQYYNDGSINEVTEYQMSLMPLVRKGIHKVKSVVFDVPESYPSRRLRSPVVYEEQKPEKTSRAVFNEDGYWYEKDLTEIARVQRPREIIYSDVIYAADSEDEDYHGYRRK